MRYCIVLILAFALLSKASSAQAQNKLSTKWEELTAGDFKEAITKSRGTCLLPFGILEKHGPHLPLGTDRNFQSLYKLVQGSSPPAPSHSAAGNPTGALATSVNGARER